MYGLLCVYCTLSHTYIFISILQAMEHRFVDLVQCFEEASIEKNMQQEKIITMKKTLGNAAYLRKVGIIVFTIFCLWSTLCLIYNSRNLFVSMHL